MPARDAVMLTGLIARIALFMGPLRRVGASSLAQYTILAVGFLAIAAQTVPELQTTTGWWLVACLWCCLAYFTLEWATRVWSIVRSGKDWAHILSPSGIVDLLGVFPIPIALLAGVSPPTAWLLGSLWILKMAQNSAGFAQLGRVFVQEAKPLASVLTLFLIVLLFAGVALHVIERDGQVATFGTLPSALWWAVTTLTTTGYGDAVPATPVGRFLAAMVMISGIAVFGLWTGILATGFAAESRRRNFIQTWDLVNKVPFFQSLSPAAVAEITHMLRRVEVPPRTAVIRRGRVGDCMYFIAEGEVEVDIRPNPVRLGPGAFFGELALLGDSIRTANVSTTQPSSLLILDLVDFRTFMARHPDLARAIDAEAKRRSSENERLRELQRQSGTA
jgi:voltage-gated potassium channel